MIKQSSLRTVLFWAVAWIFLANFFIVIRFVGSNWDGHGVIFPVHQWLILLLQANIIGLLFGIFYGIMDVYFSEVNALHRFSFGSVILIKSVGYFVAAIIVLFMGFYIAAQINYSSSTTAFNRTINFFTSGYVVVVLSYMAINTILLNFLKQANGMVGKGNLPRIFFGSYYKPSQENRIFLFIDLRSSTHYAEILGHFKYSRLIQDCFYDIASVVEKYDAMIYQYVGDEIVLTWKASGKKYKKAVHFYFAYMEKIRTRGNYYESEYGFIPEFKAGINAGKVTVAEIGVTKKEIAYHGDVLNTAARLQMACNSYGKSFLASEDFVEELGDHKKVYAQYLDQVQLKGKHDPINIYSIEQKKYIAAPV